MKKQFEMVLWQALVINFGIIFINGIIYLGYYFNDNTLRINPLILIGSCAVSIVTALASLIFSIKPIKNLPYYVIIMIHFIVVACIVVAASYLFNWVDDLFDLIWILLVYVIIYIVTWIITIKKLRKDENDINKALESNKDTD